MSEASQEFGCPACWPAAADADTAWEAFQSLGIEHEFVDDFHFSLKLRACRKCSQRFVSAFSETVDWADGDDPQFWSVVPVTPTDVDELRSAGDDVVGKACAATAPRRSLNHDHPRGPSGKSFWAQGLIIGPHD